MPEDDDPNLARLAYLLEHGDEADAPEIARLLGMGDDEDDLPLPSASHQPEPWYSSVRRWWRGGGGK